MDGRQVLGGMGLGMDDMVRHDAGGGQEHDMVQVQEHDKVQGQEDDMVLVHGNLGGVRDILASLEEERALRIQGHYGKR